MNWRATAGAAAPASVNRKHMGADGRAQGRRGQPGNHMWNTEKGGKVTCNPESGIKVTRLLVLYQATGLQTST